MSPFQKALVTLPKKFWKGWDSVQIFGLEGFPL
jgi:hypothetical protein